MTCNKQRIIEKACAQLRATLNFWLPDDMEFDPGIEIMKLDCMQSMQFRAEIELFKPDEGNGDVEPEY